MAATLFDLREDLEHAGRAPGTVRHYLSAARAFVSHHHKQPERLGAAQVRAWLRHLRARGVQPARLRTHIAALRFLYCRTLGRPRVVAFLTWPRVRLPLPTVLDAGEVARLLDATSCAGHRAFFATVYATGLRLSEARQLTLSDVDLARRTVRVRGGKGGRDRLLPLSPALERLLDDHVPDHRAPQAWLFPAHAGGPIRPKTARAALHRAAKRAGICEARDAPRPAA